MFHRRIGWPAALGVLATLAFSAPGMARAETTLTSSTLTWGKPSEMTTLDPQVSGDGTSWTVFYMVYERLVSTGDDLKPKPQLAESWQQTSPTTYEFKLRADAAFSNGRPLTAKDVVGSFKRLLDPKRGTVWGRQLASVKDVIAVDEHTVKFELSKPLTPLLAILAVSTTSIMPVEEIDNGSFDPTKTMLGSGPYMVVEHKQDESWTLARNPHYWRKDEPRADKLVIRIMGDDATRIAALKEGRIDFATFENPDTPRLLKGIDNVEVFTQHTPNFFRLDVGAIQQGALFTDQRVRTALAYAIDREQIVKVVFGGDSGVEYPVPAEFNKSACRDDPSYTLPRAERLAKAKALIQEAGAEGKSVGIIASPVLVTYPLIAQVIQRNLRDIGLKAEVQELPVADWYKRVFNKDANFDLAMSWFAGYGDPSLVLNWWNPTFAGFNAGWLKPMEGYADLMEKSRATADGPERDKILADMCKATLDGANMLALVNKPDYIAFRKDMVETKFSPVEGNFDTFKYIGEFRPKR
jgi:peptide/nickel transport system substrate-binding protein